MCEQCEQLNEQISHYRRFLNQRFDELTEQRIKAFIGDLERRKDTLHPAPKS